jgi:hypothetical protein
MFVYRCHDEPSVPEPGRVFKCWLITATESSPTKGGRPANISYSIAPYSIHVDAFGFDEGDGDIPVEARVMGEMDALTRSLSEESNESVSAPGQYGRWIVSRRDRSRSGRSKRGIRGLPTPR